MAKIKEKAKEFCEKHRDAITIGAWILCAPAAIGIYYYGWRRGMNYMGDKLLESFQAAAKFNPDMTLTEFLTKYTK